MMLPFLIVFFGLFSAVIAADNSANEPSVELSYCRTGLCAGDIDQMISGISADAAIVYNGDLIVGGYFGAADGQPVNHLARWDGSAWHNFGGVTSETITWGVSALCVYNGELIVAGRFDNAGGVPAEGIAAWDGTSWHALGDGLSPDYAVVYDMCVYDGQLIVAGNFDMAGGVPVNDLAAWNGSYWYALPGLDSDNGMMVGALTVYGGRLIASGNFDYPEGSIAAWDGVSWSSLGSGLGHYANALIEYDGQLIAGGTFTSAGGESVGKIASWNGSEWSAIGDGISNEVNNYQAIIICFHVYDGHLFAGGYFSDMDNIRVNHVASWNGTTWSSLGPGMGDNYDEYSNPVYTLTNYNSQLIAGGAFTKYHSAPGNRIAGWDGITWSEISRGYGFPFAFEIAKVDTYPGVPFGDPVSVAVTKIGGTDDMHGFDFLIGHDTEALTIMGITPGSLFDIPGDYEWDYFSYRFDTLVGYSGDYPSAVVRAVGVAALNDGSPPPISFNIPDGMELFTIHFTVTENEAFDCEFSPIQFFWMDCGDNAVALETGDLAISDNVYSTGPYGWENITDPSSDLPGLHGAPDECLTLGENPPVRYVDLINGGVRVYCTPYVYDDRGDINVNGIANEIADWVMFINYILYGMAAFGNHIEASISASDINYDGIVLSVEDLIYLHRIICGDALPFNDPPSEPADLDSVTFVQDLSTKTVSVIHEDTLAAVTLVFKGDITPEFLLDSAEHSCSYWYNGEYTSILIHPKELFYENCRTGFTEGPLFIYTGFGLPVIEGDDYRHPGAADFDNDQFMYWTPESQGINIEIAGGYDGDAMIEPYPMPRSLLRTGPSETVTLRIGGFAEHAPEEVDLSSIRVNDSIIPLATAIVPSPFEVEIIVLAQEFINSYYFGPDTTGSIWGNYLDTLSERTFVYSVSGEFDDTVPFTTLGEVTIFETPATIRVPSGWPTINEAVQIAFNGDTVEVGDGTYAGEGNRDIFMSNRSLIVRSANGPDFTTIECGGSDVEWHRGFHIAADSGSVIEGFTITGGYFDNGGGMILLDASPIISNCVFDNNEASINGGGLFCVASSPDIENCVFSSNRARAGGGMYLYQGSNAVISDCIINHNTANSSGGGILSTAGSGSTVTGCLIHNNAAPRNSAILLGIGENISILANSTIACNYSTDGSVVGIDVASSANISNCILAFNGPYKAIGCSASNIPVITCTDIYGNPGGDWVEPIADQLGVNGNISFDPMFCDTAIYDFRIDGLSPCLLYNNDCGATIGALGAGCGIICGDASGDLILNIGDAVYLIAYLFREGPEPPVPAAVDLNGNGETDVGDVTMIINFIFRNGPPLECLWD